MKKNLRLLLLMLLIGTSGLMVSCKNDDMESITLKRSGNLRVVIKNGEAPVANTQIRFYNAETGNELNISSTDANGVVDFGKLNEGNYSVYFEVLEPQYSAISQEFQVVSGENKEYSIQVKDYVGNLNLFMRDNNNNNLIEEDLGVGIAIVPDNDDFKKVFTNEEIITLAIASKYFETEGKISFENIPTGSYRMYQVRADTIVEPRGTTQITRLDDKFVNITVNVNYERLFNKSLWSVTSAIDYNSSAIIEGFPLESLAFSRNSNGQIFKMNLVNGLIVSGLVSYNGAGYFDLYSYTSNNDDIDAYWSENGISFSADGKLTIRFSYFEVDGYPTADDNFYDNYIEVTFE